ncbi:MAG: hypothetical protein R3192_14980 [Woeseiaceae bacterium]|nr:hypothetical protein [Woeseiaceae bacterium]
MQIRIASNTTTGRRVVAITCAAVVVVSTGVAQENVSLSDLERCAAFESDAEQLACFRDTLKRGDSESHAAELPATVVAPDESPQQVPARPSEKVVAGPAPQESVKRETQQPTPAPPDVESQGVVSEGAPSTSQPSELHATIVSAHRTVHGKIVATLDNGQVWRETDGSYYRGAVTAGAAVVISKRRFGGYRMKIADQPGAVLVRRSR